MVAPSGTEREARGASKRERRTVAAERAVSLGAVNADPETLPDDPRALKDHIKELQKELGRALDRELAVEARLLRELHARYGPRSERMPAAGQSLLFDLAKSADAPPSADATDPKAESPEAEASAPLEPTRTESAAPTEKKVRRPLAERLKELPCTVEPVRLAEEDRRCPCCGKLMSEIGIDSRHILDWKRASLYVRRIDRSKYACQGCHEGVLTAEPMRTPVERGLAGPGLLAHLAVSKFKDHLPLHRLEGIFERQGFEISRSTLCDWVADVAKILEPLVAWMRAQILAGPRVLSDETPVPVRDETRETTREGRIWIYTGGAPHRFVCFEYTPTREGKWPEQWLSGWRGYLQADGYSGLDRLYRSGEILEVGCWAHARRKFFEARKSDQKRAHWMLDAIGRLYAIERTAHDLSADERKRIRAERAAPILDEIRRWLDRERTIVMPKSPMGLAIQYATNQWKALVRYLEDGDLEIDNNRSERGLRCIAIGRKNWTFAGSDDGGRRAAVIYSVIASCAEHDVEPWAYLTDILERLPTFRGDLAELAPHRWKPRPTAAAPADAPATAPAAG